MKNYTVRSGGYEMTLKLSDEDACARGLLAPEKPTRRGDAEGGTGEQGRGAEEAGASPYSAGR